MASYKVGKISKPKAIVAKALKAGKVAKTSVKIPHVGHAKLKQAKPATAKGMSTTASF